MTTNDEARERIAEVLSIEKRRPHARQMIGGITAATWDEADAMIDHLWREAMTWEAIAAMAKALWVADDKPDVGHGSDGYRMEAEHRIRLVMNLILGPNPNEQEPTDAKQATATQEGTSDE